LVTSVCAVDVPPFGPVRTAVRLAPVSVLVVVMAAEAVLPSEVVAERVVSRPVSVLVVVPW
jgi:hypothetical protein